MASDDDEFDAFDDELRGENLVPVVRVSCMCNHTFTCYQRCTLFPRAKRRVLMALGYKESLLPAWKTTLSTTTKFLTPTAFAHSQHVRLQEDCTHLKNSNNEMKQAWS